MDFEFSSKSYIFCSIINDFALVQTVGGCQVLSGIFLYVLKIILKSFNPLSVVLQVLYRQGTTEAGSLRELSWELSKKSRLGCMYVL